MSDQKFDLNEYRTDKQKELSGSWQELKGGARVLVARWGNLAFREMMRKKTRRYIKQIEHRALSEEISEGILVEVMANTILLGWEGIYDKGQPLPYTVANAVRVLTELKDFRDLVASLAESADLFKAEVDEAVAKNSEPASTGS
jgi:hypothetical protein